MRLEDRDMSDDDRNTSATVRSELRNHVRNTNPDFYMSALLTPAKVRADLVTLAAFFGDLERIPVAVSDPMIAEIRLQWWRDWLEGSRDKSKTGNPIADQLAQVIAKRNLETALFQNALEGLCRELQPAPFEREQQFLEHLLQTQCAKFQLAAHIIDRDLSSPNKDSLIHAAHAYGIAHSLRRLRACAQHGRWMLPLEWSKNPAQREPPLEKHAQDARKNACIEAIARAGDAYKKTQALSANLPQEVFCTILPVALVEPYLQAFESTESDPLMVDVGITPLTRMWRLWRAHVTHEI